ncbi:DUF397 domain-containing protein [Streptomyces sparsus]
MSTEQCTGHAHLPWRKSSYSSGEGGACIEVAATEVAVLVRDSKDLSRPPLTVGRAGWAHFVRHTADG